MVGKCKEALKQRASHVLIALNTSSPSLGTDWCQGDSWDPSCEGTWGCHADSKSSQTKAWSC